MVILTPTRLTIFLLISVVRGLDRKYELLGKFKSNDTPLKVILVLLEIKFPEKDWLRVRVIKSLNPGLFRKLSD